MFPPSGSQLSVESNSRLLWFCLSKKSSATFSTDQKTNVIMVATGQEMVREKKSSRSGKCQGILFWVRENWHFEEKSGKIRIVRLI